MSADLFLTILVLAGVASLQFYKGRRLNLSLMVHYIRQFEDKLKLKDKLYTHLGGYIGFRADYVLEDEVLPKMELTLMLMPRQSLFWWPISYLFKRGDRLYVVLRPRTRVARGETHIIQKSYFVLGPGVDKGGKGFQEEEMKLKDGAQHYCLYQDRRDLERLKKLCVMSIDEPERLRHASLNPSENVIYLLLKPDVNKTGGEIARLVENFHKVFVEEEDR